MFWWKSSPWGCSNGQGCGWMLQPLWGPSDAFTPPSKLKKLAMSWSGHISVSLWENAWRSLWESCGPVETSVCCIAQSHPCAGVRGFRGQRPLEPFSAFSRQKQPQGRDEMQMFPPSADSPWGISALPPRMAELEQKCLYIASRLPREGKGLFLHSLFPVPCFKMSAGSFS